MEEHKFNTNRQTKLEAKKKKTHEKYPYTSKHIRYKEYIHNEIEPKNVKGELKDAVAL